MRDILIYSAVIAALLLSCGKKPEGDAAGPKKETAATVVLAAATAEKIEQAVEVTGSLMPWRDATISIEVDGRILSLDADLGSMVKRGTVLAKIDPTAYELSVRQAEVEFSAAGADLDRLAPLAEKNMATRQQLDDAKRRVAAAQVTLDMAKKKLADTELKAPFDGIVALRAVTAGEYARAGTAFFQIVQMSPLKFSGAVPERYAPSVKPGAAVSVLPASMPGLTVAGVVRRVGPLIGADNRAFPIEAEVPNRDLKIKSGSFATCRIAIPKGEPVVVVPEAAVAVFAGIEKVFVFADGKISERKVVTAGRDNGRTLIVEGVAAGERVVISGADTLYDGMAATPRTE